MPDRQNRKLFVNAVYAESGAPRDKETPREIGAEIESLSEFLEAKEVVIQIEFPDSGNAQFIRSHEE